MRRRSSHGTGGFTLIELLLAMGLLVIIGYKGFRILATAADATARDTATVLLEERAQLVLDKIARAVMSSDRDTLMPDAESPLSTDDLEYRINLGVEDGEVVWSDPEMIGLEDMDNEVFWSRMPDVGATHRVVWTNLVRPYLEGELPNGMDDNGNGLIDEKGLSFAVDRNAVTIRITLDRRTADGRTLTRTVETTVTCRNPMDTTL